ncbi:MAG: extracellular solute-binding protein [Acidipropionibacterium acidipropionici]|uniref:extracellular solute-binding protein n=1 Tax=Acidipropionibacterium acidipropionici TaxID=1748 RepID=UPI002F35A8DE
MATHTRSSGAGAQRPPAQGPGPGSQTPPASSPRRLSRRSVLRGTAALGGAAALTGGLTACSGSGTFATGGRTPVRIWDLFTGADGERMQTMQAACMKAHKDVSIESTTLSWGSAYYTKLAMASSGGRPPEAAVMHMSRLAGYAPGGLLEPFDLDRLAAYGVTRKDFAPAVWERATYKGEIFALPLDTHPFITFYSPKVARKAGLLDSSGKMRSLDSKDAFLDAGRSMARATGKYGMSFGYLLDTAQSWRLFWGLYGQTGGQYRMVPGSSAQLDESAAIEVLSFIQEVLNGKIASRNADYAGAIAAFSSGKAGMILSGEWEIVGFKASMPDVAAMPFPKIFDKPANYADSHAFVLPKQDYPDEKRREATYKVLADLVKNRSLTWAEGGHIPAYMPVLATGAYRKLSPQRDYAAASKIVTLDPKVWFAGAGSDFQARMCDAMAPTLQGQKTAKQGVEAMLSQLDRLLAAPQPM